MKTLPQEYYTMLWDLQSVEFVLVELTLYLDTHPGDTAAIAQFNEYAQLRAQITETFERQFGPLTHHGTSTSTERWMWSEAPWPWQV